VTGPKVVVIGGGIVGACLLAEITARGWDDVTLLDAGSLPAAGGSTSHAPGVVFQTNGTKTMTDFASYTVRTLRDLDCYLPVGGLEIATTPARLAELQRRHGFATSWGVAGAELLDPEQTVRKWDLLNPDRILGGLFVPDDGIAKAVAAVDTLISIGRERGARVLDGTEVLSLETVGDRVTAVVTTAGVFEADIVVCCAGIWGPTVAGMVGMPLALTPLAHQLAWTDPLDALCGQTAEATRPVLRHQDASLYYRQRYGGLAIGSYHHRPMPVRTDDLAHWRADRTDLPGAMPSVLPFTEEDFAFALAETADLLPSAKDLTLAEAINGVFSFTTDNLPLLGPSPEYPNFWVAEAVWITHSAGVARAMAEWIVDGYCSSFDLHGCEVNRFEPHQLAPAYVLAKDCQNFAEVYDIIHPLQPMEHSRPLRTSPFHHRQIGLGAVFLETNGWERPQWYESNTALLGSRRDPGRHIPRPDPWAARFTSPATAVEAAITRTDVALYDMTALKRIEVSGPGSTEFLQGLVTGNIAKSVGSVTYCLLLDAGGGIRSDITVARLDDQRFQIGANGQADLDWLLRHVPTGSAVQVRDVTAGTCCLGLWGPRARAVIEQITDTDFSHQGFKYFRAKSAYLGTVPVTALRLSYVGELGWELYTTADQGLALWDLLMRAGEPFGIIAAGRGAFNSLRIEKGYRSFGTDMTHEHDPYEAGLGFAVNLEKGDFLGREALLARGRAVARKLCLLTVDEPDGVVLGSEPVLHEGSAVGYVTSAGYSYTLGTPLAYAWLPIALSTPGTAVHISWFDRPIPARVTAEPAFDPGMTRIRC